MFKHLKFILTAPKIGPDMYLTHWLLYYKPFRLWFQKRKLYRIGEGSEIRPFAVIDGTHQVIIGKNTIIPEGTILSTEWDNKDSKIIIEDDVLIAPRVAIYSTTHNYANTTIPIKAQGYKSATTVIKSGAWIGINSVIMPGVIVGKNSIVGANSLVNKDVPDYAVVAGSPAIIIKLLK